MYKVLDAPKRMTRKEIIKEFDGKWVFFIDMEGPVYGWFKSAVPVVVADKPFEGFETGIYQKFRDENAGNYSDLTLLPNENNVFGFDEVTVNGF